MRAGRTRAMGVLQISSRPSCHPCRPPQDAELAWLAEAWAESQDLKRPCARQAAEALKCGA